MEKTNAAALAKRQKQSVIVARMLLTCLKASHKNFHTKHLGAMFEPYLVAMAVVQSERPMTIAEIAKELGMPRSNTLRGVRELLRFGAFLKAGRKYVISPDYLAARAEADYFLTMLEAIGVASRELAKLDGPEMGSSANGRLRECIPRS